MSRDAPLGSSTLAQAVMLPQGSIKGKHNSLYGVRLYLLLSNPRTWHGSEVSHSQHERRIWEGDPGRCPPRSLALAVQIASSRGSKN